MNVLARVDVTADVHQIKRSRLFLFIVHRYVHYIICVIGEMGDRGARGPTVRGPKGQPGPPGLPGESILPFRSAVSLF